MFKVRVVFFNTTPGGRLRLAEPPAGPFFVTRVSLQDVRTLPLCACIIYLLIARAAMSRR